MPTAAHPLPTTAAASTDAGAIGKQGAADMLAHPLEHNANGYAASTRRTGQLVTKRPTVTRDSG